jgi:hypothetical protein
MDGKRVLLALAAAFAAVGAGFSMAQKELENAAEAGDDAKPAGGKTATTPQPRAAVGGAKGKGGKAPKVTLDELKEKLVGYVNDENGGKERGMAVLTRHGAKRISDLKEAQYDAFNEYLDKCINGDVDPLQADEPGNNGDDPFA